MAERLAQAGRRAREAQGSLFAPSGRTGWTRTRKPAISEASLHATIAHMLDWLLLPPAVYTTFPAGWGKMTRAMAGMLRHCGLKPGMPDILVFFMGRTLGIELKTEGRKQSTVQIAMTAQLRGAGVEVFVARSPEEVMEILRREGIPVKKTGGTL